ncbi:MAG: acylphosphatase [Thermoplasmatales archaeon]|nr:acylphosphatase [Thermoplasmatales archaeon]
MEKKVKARIVVDGRVQKAGYKDTVDEIAYHLNLKGYVKNLDDGTVEIVCEGKKKDIEELVEKIRVREYPIFVESVKVEYSEPMGEFKQFDIIREKDITEATYERMDAAARYMRGMNKDLGEKIGSMHHDLKDGQDKMLEKQDETIKIIESGNKMLGEKQNKTIEIIGTRFGDMDVKYGDISKTMREMHNDLKEMKNLFAKLVNHIVNK